MPIEKGTSAVPRQFVICVRNDEVPASLELRKIYEALPAADGEAGWVRVVDESGEDYLYPRDWFIDVDLTLEQRLALRLVS